MNKNHCGIVSAFLGIVCLGLPTLAQETQPNKPARPPYFTSKVEPGQFTITPSPDGSVAIEIYDAPLEPVLQDVAMLAHRKLLISDEAREQLKTYTGATFKIKVQTIEEAFNLLASGFSWGKIGKDTYLLVVREKSTVEVAAEKADQVKREKERQAPRSQEPEQAPNEPQIAPMKGRLYLLPAPLNTQQNQ